MTALLSVFLAAGPSLPPPMPVSFLWMLADETVTAPTQAAVAQVARLEWPGEIRIDPESSPQELIVRFERAPDEKAISAFAEKAGPDLADLRWNDTSLVLRPAIGRRVEASAQGRVLVVRFLPEDEEVPTPAAQQAPAPTGEQDLELGLARAQADAAAGYPGRARDQLARLATRYPEDKRVQRLLADAEAAEGATSLAAMRYRNIAADDPFALRTIAEAGGHATGSFTIRGGKVFSQGEGNLNAIIRLSPSFALGAGIRHFETHADTVVNRAGISSDVDSRSTIADAFAILNLGPETRLEFQGSAQLDKKVAGAGIRLFAGPPERQGRVVLAYRLPDVATPEQSTFGGHVSRAGIGGTLRLTPELTVQADGAWNGYGLAGGGVRSETFTVTAGADFLLRRQSPSLAIAYRLDAEYVERAKKRTNGLEFIPLSDRENHSLQLVSSVSFAKVQLTGAAGWTVDRLGDRDGPTANISAASRLGTRWRLEASGGVSSITRPGISGRQLYLRVALTRYLGRR